VYKSDKDMKKPLTEILFSECTKVERKPKEPKDSPSFISFILFYKKKIIAHL